MAEQTSKLLKDYLEEMNDSMLSEFKWYLSQYQEKGCRPLQRSQLESSTRTETVDQLVQAFGGDGAVVRAVDVLYRMKLNDLATKLAQAKMERDAEEERQVERQVELQPPPRDLFCSVCLCVFRTPVMLRCGHSFCRTCVQQTWAGKASRKCPLCEQVDTEGHLQVNFSLKSLSENYTQSQVPHQDVTKKPEDWEEVNACSSAVEQLKRQSCTTQRRIKEEFEKLGRCLKTEEVNRLVALKQEESQKIRLIQMIEEAIRDMSALSDTVKNMEELVTDSSFLKKFKSCLERTQTALLDLELQQVQIDEAKYMDNLQLRVLRKMLRITKNIPGPPAEPEASPRRPRPGGGGGGPRPGGAEQTRRADDGAAEEPL